jgi:hypothetical protein
MQCTYTANMIEFIGKGAQRIQQHTHVLRLVPVIHAPSYIHS